ncbi:unnamed protein product [Enterobius vermicularis]|uniref:MFS domain-containing protein n=1 Tax=Enterobius vermicularis TaxID=51028 RepID=A0A0N4VAD9_ENTVE|nr:unnamed protein product [Enterobius vermicularis]
MKPLMIKSLAIENDLRSVKLWSRSECRLWTINLFLGTCVLYAARVALPLCTAAVAVEFRWNKNDSGTVLSCFFWGYACTQLFAGAFADRIGGERILCVTTFLWAVLTYLTPKLFEFAYLSTPNPLYLVVLVRVLFGITQGFHMPSLASITSRHLSHSDKGRVFGICSAGSHLGTVIAAVFGSFLLDAFGWRTLFHFMGTISLLWWASFRWLASSQTVHRTWSLSPEKGIEKDKESAVNENLKIPLRTPISGRESSSKVPWGILLRNPAFWGAVVAQYCGANAYYTMFSWLPSYFADTFPTAVGMVYNVVPSVSIVITSFCAPFLASHLTTQLQSLTNTRKIMEALSLLGMAVSLTLASFSDHFYSSLVLFTIAMGARGFHHGGVSVNPCDFAPYHTGTVFGIFNAFASVTGFLGVYIAGCILHETGNNWAYVFTLSAIQCVAGAAVYAYLGTGLRII